MNEWFDLRGRINSTSSWLLSGIGFIITISLWWITAELLSTQNPVVEGYNPYLPSLLDSTNQLNRDSILRSDSLMLSNAKVFKKVYPLLPRPDHVLFAFGDLYTKENVISNTGHSIWLNIQGYVWAILISIIIGMILGLFPLFRSLFTKQVDAMRYLPLSALTGLFITWFGLGDPMKIAFLAFGIIVYLIPVVVQRLDEVDEVLLQTSYTLGATKWQKIKTVLFPGILSKITDDIRVLTAISWTYIIIAELLNKGEGIGSLIYTKLRQGQMDRVFALLLLIMLIGIAQDKLFVLFDKIINPHKYYKNQVEGLKEGMIGVISIGLGIIVGITFNYFIKVDFLQTMAWLLGIAGGLMLIFAFFKMENTNRK